MEKGEDCNLRESRGRRGGGAVLGALLFFLGAGTGRKRIASFGRGKGGEKSSFHRPSASLHRELYLLHARREKKMRLFLLLRKIKKGLFY